MRKKIKSAPKNIFSRATLRSDVAALGEDIRRRGMPSLMLALTLGLMMLQRQVKITFKIDEGGIYKIGRIDISGNIKTMDKVIEGKSGLMRGDTFNSKHLKRSHERLNNLNFF